MSDPGLSQVLNDMRTLSQHISHQATLYGDLANQLRRLQKAMLRMTMMICGSIVGSAVIVSITLMI